MKLWKLIDGLLVKAPDNLQDEEALAAGYKPLRWTQCPGDISFYTDVWSEEETELVQRWITAPAGRGADEPASAAMLAATEDSMTATRNYDAGDLMSVSGVLYAVTEATPNGGVISPGVNVTPTTMAEQLALLADKKS